MTTPTFEPHFYYIGKHWIPVLEYADYSDTTDQEEKQLGAFLGSLPGPGCWDWGDDWDTNFTRDEVSGLMADCVKAVYWAEV